MSTLFYPRYAVLLPLLAILLLSGCAHVVKSGANVALNFGESRVVPPILTMDDVDMICNTGVALTPSVMATQAMGAEPNRMAVLLYAGAALCAENQALESELRYLRATKHDAVTEAQNARIEQKRWAALAAKRQYRAYQLLNQYWEMQYKTKLGEACPKMPNEIEQLIYMIGLLSGLQALNNDMVSGGLNVPRDIAAIVERGMVCLDNTKFWGVPNATRAVIWISLPGANIGKPDPYVTLKQSMQLGEQGGVHLSHALYVLAAQSSGDDRKIRDALKAYVASRNENNQINANYRLLDAMANTMIRAVADRYWTEHTGVRSDEANMATFWDEQTEPAHEIDELLNPPENTPH